MGFTTRTLATLGFVLTVSGSLWAQDQDNYTIPNGCRSKEAMGNQYPIFVEDYGNCQIYMLTTTFQVVGDLRVAKGHESKCINQHVVSFQGSEYVIAYNPNFKNSKYRLASLNEKILNPANNRLPKQGVYWSEYKERSSIQPDSYDNLRTARKEMTERIVACRATIPGRATYDAGVNAKQGLIQGQDAIGVP